MRCLNPRPVGFYADGRTLAWSYKKCSKEYPIFQLPCGKCLKCRLEYARSAAIRCVHEAKMYENNSFITLTYSDEHLQSNKLIYKDFQDFIKRLRSHIWEKAVKRLKSAGINVETLSKQARKELNDQLAISVFVTGEYGDQKKRPHWHALIFNWKPDDQEYLYKNKRGDPLFKSKTLDELWGKNDPEKKPNEVGAVSFHSAGYVARYAAKKLVHGNDQDHEFHPIHKRSSKHAIGKKFVEKYWRDIFNKGYCVIQTDDGNIHKAPIPRYYEKWLHKNKPEEWIRYVTQTKPKTIRAIEEKDKKEKKIRDEINHRRLDERKPLQISQAEVERTLINERFKRLQAARTGD